jgi:Cu(I)/Ag(I) efflux system membrane fusion protein
MIRHTAVLGAIGLIVGGVWLAGSVRRVRATRPGSVGDAAVLYYRDPMHPTYTSKTPGKSPDCGMDLEPVYADVPGSASPGTLTLAAHSVQIDGERQQKIGIRVGVVQKGRASGVRRVLGRVVLDETRDFPVVAGGDGWVTAIAPGSTTGSAVRKGQSLASIYGRDYVTAQRSFLYAQQAAEHPAPGPPDLQAQTTLTLQEARLVLQSLGFGPDGIQQLAQTHEILTQMALTAPASGVILARNVFPNQRFDKGTQLFHIADLSHIWVLADLSRDDDERVRSGDIATLTVANQPGVRWRGEVAAVLPAFDAASRTFKVRLETDNPHLVLRPDMYVDVEFAFTIPDAVTVPVDAVIESGRYKTVFVNQGAGNFEPRVVETGERLGDRLQILRGLTGGESIVVSGHFLLDSESRMRSEASSGHD